MQVNFLEELKDKWETLQNTPKIFAYQLNVTQRKYLSGQYMFYTELNPQRSALRRAPQTICSLNPSFDESRFNFKKINPLELITKICHEGIEVSMIINKSPLSQYHMLICPDIEAGHAQKITPVCLSFSTTLLRHLTKSKSEWPFRIGYNSPGALASVNHLHLHLLYIVADLYIETAKLEPLVDSFIFRLSTDMPTEAICFIIYESDSEKDVALKINKVYEYLEWLVAQNMPHNIFMTAADREGYDLKVFVYARQNYCTTKDLTSFNVGFCELSGYIPIGDTEQFGKLTEQEVITNIRWETGEVYKKIYKYFTKK